MILLGSAGQRIITAGEILCLAGLSAGLNTSQKNDYNITVLRGPSISELILSPQEIDYTGLQNPDVIVALAQEGVDRRRHMFAKLDAGALILQIAGVNVPDCNARVHQIDLKARGIRNSDWALASVGLLAAWEKIINFQMLEAALKIRFKGQTLADSLELVQKSGLG